MGQPPASYFDTSTWDPRDVVSGGSRMVPIDTPSGTFRVWTKRVGTNPDLKVLLLHGGPGSSDELYECFDAWFPGAGIEYYYYDQLGSFRSDQPDDPSLWDLARFVDEVEQVRQALRLDSSNFVLLGQSWGGILAMEYAVHHQQHLKGLVISNMMSSARLYNDYATNVLMPTMDQGVLAEIKRFEADGTTDDPLYEQLLMEHHYVLHVCRMPLEDWPDPVKRGIAISTRRSTSRCRPERARFERQPGGVGSLDRPAEHRCADAGHRGDPRHDGPGAHALVVRAAASGPVPALPGREPPLAVRRSRALLPGPDRLPPVPVGGSFAVLARGCDDVTPDREMSALAQTKTTRTRTLTAVILAAGKGKRLKSARPKVLHPICGKPALWHVVQAAIGAKPTKIVVVVGHGADDVRAAVRAWGITPSPIFVEQAEQRGTGHAVAVAEKAVGRADDVLVMGGDFDPLTVDDIKTLVRTHRRSSSAATISTAEVLDPGGYGRVIRDGNRLVRIVEHADATPAERAIHEVWLVATVFRRKDLFRALPLVGDDNRQHEYYLNGVFPILLDKGEKISAIEVDTGGVMGLNSRGGLAAVTRVVRERINAVHMANGVTLLDPATTYIDVGVRIAPDTTIGPSSTIEGDTTIGRNCRIGPSVQIRDATIGDGATIRFAVIEEARLARNVTVGPFARIRPGTTLANNVIVGSYVEVKNSEIGTDSKVPHLSYVGDATVGKRTNVGAANVTANWDGYRKHRTVIGDDVRTGSDTIMVAPVTIGDGAMTGAGSVISKDVPAGALAVERTEQRIVEGYRDRKDAQHRARTAKGE